jgi:hypothetical protein
MPQLQLKQLAHSEVSCVAFRKILLKSVQRRGYLTGAHSWKETAVKTLVSSKISSARLEVKVLRFDGRVGYAQPIHTHSFGFHLDLESDGGGDPSTD